VRAGPQRLQPGDDLRHLVVEAEGAGLGRDLARIRPVRDVNVVVRQQGGDGAAQPGGEMAGQRRHDQQGRPRAGYVLGEAQQAAEGGVGHHHLPHRHRPVAGAGLRQSEGWLVMRGAEILEKVQRQAGGAAGLGGLQQRRGMPGEWPQPGRPFLLGLVEMVEHGR
jgi:hypothetical protein